MVPLWGGGGIVWHTIVLQTIPGYILAPCYKMPGTAARFDSSNSVTLAEYH